MRFLVAFAVSTRSMLRASRRLTSGAEVTTADRTDVDSPDDTLPESSYHLSGTRRGDIQALRALAVIAVFAYHAVPEHFPGGFVGVDVFFVVSGYLVGGALVAEVSSTGRLALRRFYARRVRRIVPLATVVAAVTLIAAIFTTSPLRLVIWGSPPGLASVTRDGISSVLGISNLWFGVSDVGYAMNSYVSPFTHYWSLGVEEQFYVVAPLAIAVAFRGGRAIGKLALVAASIVSFDLAILGFAPAGIEAFYNPVSRAWELGVGVLVAIATPSLRALATRGVLTTSFVWASWLALAACAVWIAAPDGWPTTTAIIPVTATAVILGAGTVRRAGRLASWRVFQWLGDRSYGIYLWHWPVIVMAVPHSPFARSTTIAAAAAATIALSAASYRWVERPIRRRPLGSTSEVRRMFGTGMAIVAGGLTILAGVGTWASTRPLDTSIIAPRYRLLPAGDSEQQFATRVPLNLRPSLANAYADTPIAYLDGCNTMTARGTIGLSECVYGTSGPLVVLFGDSHALQWLAALLPATERGDIRVALVTADACPPFDPASLAYRRVCAEWHQRAIDRVNTLRPDLIVASASLSEPPLNGEAHMATASLAVSRLATELHEADVLWIVDTPALEQDPSGCAAKNVSDITQCATPRSTALPQAVRAPFQRAVEANGWHLLDLSDDICDETECGIILGDVFMYRDDDHLSSTFAAELSQALMSAITPLVDN